jgi:hypothetical protein
MPYTIHIVLTDNGIRFGDMPSGLPARRPGYRLHMFDHICREHGIEHLLTKPNHPSSLPHNCELGAAIRKPASEAPLVMPIQTEARPKIKTRRRDG